MTRELLLIIFPIGSGTGWRSAATLQPPVEITSIFLPDFASPSWSAPTEFVAEHPKPDVARLYDTENAHCPRSDIPRGKVQVGPSSPQGETTSFKVGSTQQPRHSTFFLREHLAQHEEGNTHLRPKKERKSWCAANGLLFGNGHTQGWANVSFRCLFWRLLLVFRLLRLCVFSLLGRDRISPQQGCSLGS